MNAIKTLLLVVLCTVCVVCAVLDCRNRDDPRIVRRHAFLGLLVGVAIWWFVTHRLSGF